MRRNASNFVVDGICAMRLIGACVGGMGLFLGVAGIETIVFSRIGIHRYEKKTGRLIRFFSTGDQSAYIALKSMVTVGLAVGGMGLAFMLLGIAIILWPLKAYRILTALGIALQARSPPSP